LGDCLSYNGKFTRLDIAIDDTKPYLEIRETGQKIKKKNYEQYEKTGFAVKTYGVFNQFPNILS